MEKEEKRASFELYKSSICHYVKAKGDIDFLIEMLETDRVRELYNKEWYPEAFYLLGMVDYLSRVNGIEQCNIYDDIRCCRLEKLLYPGSMRVYYAALGEEIPEEKILKEAIPEFLRFNIVESEVRNVC